MKRKIRCALAAAALIGSAQAQTKWDMPTPYSDGEFHTRNVRAFVEDVKKATDGALDITVHSNGSLIKHPDILRAVSTGQVNIADLKGTKFRTYSPLTARLAELLGASPTVVQVPDVPQLFATGGIQAMITSSATGTATKAWEFVKNYYNTSAFHPKNAVVINARSFSRLPDAQKKALTYAASTAETRGWAMSRVRQLEANETLAKNGMTLHEPDAGMRAAFGKVGNQILEEWLKKSGAEGQALIKSYRGK